MITSKCIIRDLEKSDARSLAKNANSRKIWNNVRDFFPHPYLESDATDFINMNRAMHPATNFAIDIDGRVVGIVGIVLQGDVYRKSAEVGYWLGEKYWGKGIMTEALKCIINYAFERFDIIRIYGGVFEYNKASMRVLEKAGFRLEAILEKAAFKNDEYINEYRYAIFKPGI